jgi:site-specific DNA recombinase
MNRCTTHEYPITSEPALKNNGPIRCAIYTRKSTEEGLEQEFNSLDAQRESAKAYIISQCHEGWICLPDRYDDCGFSGGNMERPALQRLFADIEAGGIDCVVVDKVDRMSRALLDFSRIIDLFDKPTEFIPSPQEKREGLIRDHVLGLLENLHRRIERLECKAGLLDDEAKAFSELFKSIKIDETRNLDRICTQVR